MIVGEMHNDLFYKCDAFTTLEQLVVDKFLSSRDALKAISDTETLKSLVGEAIRDLPKKIPGTASIKRGGNGNNSTELFGKLGVPVKLMTVVGKGSRWMFEELKEMGVDTSCVFEVDATTPISTIIEDPSTTKIFVAPNLKQSMNFTSVTISPAMFGDASLVFFTPLAPKFKPVLDAMAKGNVRVLTAITIESQALDDLASIDATLARKVDIAFINKADALSITNAGSVAAADAVLSKVARIRVITLGKDGCFIRSDLAGEVFVPVVTVPVVDRTGAGDAFAAGVLLRCHELIEQHGNFMDHLDSLAPGQRASLLEDIGKFGSCVAALKVSKARTPTKAELEAFLASH